MPDMFVNLLRTVDDDFPGFVECELVDAAGERHLFVDKLPVVTGGPSDTCPQPGVIACTIEARCTDERGEALLRVSTERPYGVASTTGRTVFTVRAAQVRE